MSPRRGRRWRTSVPVHSDWRQHCSTSNGPVPISRFGCIRILEKVPTVVDIYLDRPAVIPEIAGESAALLANFGATDAAVLDVIFGRFVPTGRLPFELPSSMEAVRRQREDVPYDSANPLFPFGFGLTYFT